MEGISIMRRHRVVNLVEAVVSRWKKQDPGDLAVTIVFLPKHNKGKMARQLRPLTGGMTTRPGGPNPCRRTV